MVITPSRFAFEILGKSGVFPRARQQIVPNSHGWTEKQLDSIRRDGAQTNDLNLLFLGRLEPEKGLRELCAAFASVASRWPALHLTIAGWGSLEAELHEAYAAQANITFVGQVSGEQKARLLSDSSAVVVPSSCAESFGLVILEAYAYGKPAIASRIGALPELIQPGKTGWLVQPGSAQALAESIESIARNPGNLQPMSSACYQMARRFSVDEMIREYEKIYFDLKAPA